MIPRLFVTVDLKPGAVFAAEERPAHYLKNVMRRAAGDPVILFNGRDGEFAAEIAGVSKRSADFRVHPVEPSNSPTLSTGHKVGKHRIQGISDEFIPSIVNLAELSHVVDVWDGDAILMSQAMCHRLGLGVGISAGANIIGAIKLVEEMGPDSVVVTRKYQ